MTIKNYGVLDTVESLKEYITRVIEGGKVFAFDIETGYDGPDMKGGAKLPFHPQFKVVGISFTDDPDWARYVPIAHDNGQNVPTVAVARLFWHLLNTGRGIPHNAMFELQGMGRFFRETLSDDPFFGAAVRKAHGYYPIFSDTMIEANMMQCYQPLGAGGGVGVGLKGLTWHIFKHKMTEFMDLFPEEDSELGPGTPKSKRSVVRFNTRELVPKVVEYACEDSSWTLSLHLYHYPQVAESLMFRTEIMLLNVLVEMELEGLALDWAEYERRAVEVSEFIGLMNEEIQAYFSDRLQELVSVNLGSPKQVAELLYDKLGLPEQINSKTKNRTTDEKAITTLERQDAGVRRIAQWREVAKLQSSYITKYLKDLHYAEDGRAHPNHNQLGAGTGRFSVDHVSYQQWPKPYSWTLDSGKKFNLNYRNFLITPDEHWRIIGFDFSQVELRILAGMTNETAMLKAFEDGIDIHKATASTMLKIPLDELTEKDRAKGKTLNFGIVYGLGVDALAETLGISYDEAEVLLQQYFEAFPGLRSWMNDRVLEGGRHKEVSTLFGRRFHIWEYDDYERLMAKASRMPNDTEAEINERKRIERWARRQRSKADRMCVNAPVQGGAADYIKIGMVRAQKAIKEAGLEDKIKMVMTIHDALEFYVHESVSTQEVIDLLNPCVSFPITGLPEILAEWHEGKRWGDVVEIKLDKRKQIMGYEWKKQHFESIEEAYAVIETPEVIPEPVKEEATSEMVLVIELDEAPLTTDWDILTEYLIGHESGETRILVKLEGTSRFLPYTTKAFPSDLEEMRFIVPNANFKLEQISLDKTLVEA